MARLYVFAIFALFAVLTKAERELENSIEDIQESSAKLGPLQRGDGSLETFHYTFGKRRPDDRIVGQINQTFNRVLPKNFIHTIIYPEAGRVGERISFVDISVDQTSHLSKAEIHWTGQREFSLKLQANETTFFKYRITIYGY